MADEIIGSLGVQIEADSSDFKNQLDEAVGEAESASERMATAFESLVGIGEALAITESLKEFGEEALTAYGTVQSVTIGLTQLTKSASDANDIIEQVKTLAATEPFAFPEIAPTVQKMVALGVSAEQIPEVMQAAADASAATGNSFQQVANSIDRMSLSGTASARALTQLGISTQDLGNAMGVSADQVKAAFLAMDQEDRLNAITEALQKFSGAAAAQAQSIAGQWQLLQNQFEEVMVGIGEALAPAISAIMSFASQALSVAQEFIDGFNKLPEPIKLVVDAVAILAAAVPPLFVAFGLLGQGIIGVQAVMGPFNELLVTMGLREGEAAVSTSALAASEGELAIATKAAATSAEESGVAASGAVFGFQAMDTAVKGAGAAVVGLLEYDLLKWADTNVPAFHQMADAAYDFGQKAIDAFTGIKGGSEAFTLWITGALKPGAAAADQLSQSTFLLSQKLGELGVVIPRGTMSMQDWDAALQQAAASYQKNQESASGLGGGLDALVAKQEKLNATEQQAAADLLIAKKAYEDGVVPITVLAAAQDAYDKALTATQSKSAAFKDSVAGITDAYGKQQAAIATLQNTVMQLLAAQDGSLKQTELLAAAEGKLDAAYAAVDKSAKSLANTIQGTGELFTYMGDQAEALVQKQRDLTLGVQEAKAVLDQLNASTDASREHTAAVIVALEQYQAALKNAGQDLNALQTITVGGVLETGKLADIIKQAKENMADFATTTATVPQVLDALQTSTMGLVASGQYFASGLTDQITLITGKAIPAYQAFSDTHKNLQSVLTGTNTGLQTVTSQIEGYITKAAQATNENGTFANSLKTASASVNQLGSDAAGNVDNMSQFANSISGVTSAATQMSQALDNADASMQQFVKGTEGALGSTGAAGLGAWTLNAVLSPLTVFAGSGTTKDAQGFFESALDQLGAAEQRDAQAAAAAAAATTTHTAAVVTHTAAVTTSTTATTNATTATKSLTTATTDLTQAAVDAATKIRTTSDVLNESSTTVTDSLGNVTTTYQTTAAAQRQFVDGLGNVYNSYQALVDAIKNNPLLAGPATATTGNPLSGPSAPPSQQFTDGMGNIYPSYQALLAALAKDPGLAGPHTTGLPFGGLPPSLSPGTNVQTFGLQPNGIGITNPDQFWNLFPQGATGITSNPYNYTPTVPGSTGGFGQGVGISGQPLPGGVTINMSYPQFNSQAQAQQIMNQMITMLRTVPGLKL